MLPASPPSEPPAPTPVQVSSSRRAPRGPQHARPLSQDVPYQSQQQTEGRKRVGVSGLCRLAPPDPRAHLTRMQRGCLGLEKGRDLPRGRQYPHACRTLRSRPQFALSHPHCANGHTACGRSAIPPGVISRWGWRGNPGMDSTSVPTPWSSAYAPPLTQDALRSCPYKACCSLCHGAAPFPRGRAQEQSQKQGERASVWWPEAVMALGA